MVAGNRAVKIVDSCTPMKQSTRLSMPISGDQGQKDKAILM